MQEKGYYIILDLFHLVRVGPLESYLLNTGKWGSMVGTMDERSPQSHLYDPGFDSRTRHLMWVEFVVGSFLAPRVFLQFSGFPPSTKTNTSKFQFDLDVRASIDNSPHD